MQAFKLVDVVNNLGDMVLVLLILQPDLREFLSPFRIALLEKTSKIFQAQVLF